MTFREAYETGSMIIGLPQGPPREGPTPRLMDAEMNASASRSSPTTGPPGPQGPPTCHTHSHSFRRACGVLCILCASWALMMSRCSMRPPRLRFMTSGLTGRKVLEPASSVELPSQPGPSPSCTGKKLSKPAIAERGEAGSMPTSSEASASSRAHCCGRHASSSGRARTWRRRPAAPGSGLPPVAGHRAGSGSLRPGLSPRISGTITEHCSAREKVGRDKGWGGGGGKDHGHREIEKREINDSTLQD